MNERITFAVYAQEHERFGRNAFTLGSGTAVHTPDGQIRSGVIRGFDVSDDGTSAELTVEIL